MASFRKSVPWRINCVNSSSVRPAGRPSPWGDVTRQKWSEGRATGEVTRLVDYFWFTGEWIPTCRIRRNGVTIVAPALRVDDVTSLKDQRGIESPHVERYRRDLGASLNLACSLSREGDLRRGEPNPDEDRDQQQISNLSTHVDSLSNGVSETVGVYPTADRLHDRFRASLSNCRSGYRKPPVTGNP